MKIYVIAFFMSSTGIALSNGKNNAKAKTIKCDFSKTTVNEDEYSEDGVWDSQLLAKYVLDILKNKGSEKFPPDAVSISKKYFGSISQDDPKILYDKIYAVLISQRDCIKSKDFEKLVEHWNKKRGM